VPNSRILIHQATARFQGTASDIDVQACGQQRVGMAPHTMLGMSRPGTSEEIVAIVERHVDDAHRRVLRSTTDPARGLPRFKKKAEGALDERVLDVLLRLLGEIHPATLTVDQLRTASYERIDGPTLAAEDTRLRRRLQGIPEVAPSAN